MSAQQNQLKDLTEEDFNSLVSSYSYTPVSFLQYYIYAFSRCLLSRATYSNSYKQYSAKVLGRYEKTGN